MSALQVLEDTVLEEHHARARETAKVLCRRVGEMLNAGVSASEIYCDLNALYDRYRSSGDSVMRDAIAEVLDWFEDEGLTQTA